MAAAGEAKGVEAATEIAPDRVYVSKDLQPFLDAILVEYENTGVNREQMVNFIKKEVAFRLCQLNREDNSRDKINGYRTECDAARITKALMATFAGPGDFPALTGETLSKAEEATQGPLKVLMGRKVSDSDARTLMMEYLGTQAIVSQFRGKPFVNHAMAIALTGTSAFNAMLINYGVGRCRENRNGRFVAPTDYAPHLSDAACRKAIRGLPEGTTKKELLPLLQNPEDIRAEVVAILERRINARGLMRSDEKQTAYETLYRTTSNALSVKRAFEEEHPLPSTTVVAGHATIVPPPPPPERAGGGAATGVHAPAIVVGRRDALGGQVPPPPPALGPGMGNEGGVGGPPSV